MSHAPAHADARKGDAVEPASAVRMNANPPGSDAQREANAQDATQEPAVAVAEVECEAFILRERNDRRTRALGNAIKRRSLWLIVFFLSRARRDRSAPAASPSPGTGIDSQFLLDQRMCARSVNTLVRNPSRDGFFRLIACISLALTGIVLWGIGSRFIPTTEGTAFDLCLGAGFIALVLLLVLAHVRLVLLWSRLARLFHQLSLIPMACAFDRIPASVSNLFGRFLQAERLNGVDFAHSRQQWTRLRSTYGPPVAASLSTWFGPGSAELARIERVMSSEFGTQLVRERSGLGTRGHDALHELSSALLPVVMHMWPGRPLEEAFGGQLSGQRPVDNDSDRDTAKGDKAVTSKPEDTWFRHAEDYLAIQTVFWVSQYAAHLRNLVSFLTVGPILLLLATTWYPFQPQRYLGILIWSFIVLTVLTALVIFVQVERDTFVSRVSKTRANAVTFDRTFLSTVMTHFVPIFGLLLAQFGGIAYWINSLFEPLGRVLK
jgi:hypothetical protein